MRRFGGFVRRNALSGALLLVAVSTALSAYAVNQIGAERTATIKRDCLAQNRRHTNTIAELDALLADAVRKHPERRVQITQSRTATVLLINTLAPYRDCEQVLAKSRSTKST